MNPAQFRNGNRIVLARQQPSGDWIITDPGGQHYLEVDTEFRAHWEPVNRQAVQLWTAGQVRLAYRF
tara:strand:- start:127 stop:327 length:201 start_codon:yes stop_codon:yes gene_type:complete